MYAREGNFCCIHNKKSLRQSLGFDIIGVTATASLERKSGYHDMGITLTVITDDDVDIAIGCCELSREHAEQQITDAYAKAISQSRISSSTGSFCRNC
jgi:hypothetical protein